MEDALRYFKKVPIDSPTKNVRFFHFFSFVVENSDGESFSGLFRRFSGLFRAFPVACFFADSPLVSAFFDPKKQVFWQKQKKKKKKKYYFFLLFFHMPKNRFFG